ncbi:MAG: arsenate reductase (azurin) small subunit [Caldilineae bacterium]|nr:MAG: arsenate reductase (azurin) small subunit [Caldilineae bacterium]
MTNATDEKQNEQGVSRRDFLRMGGAAVGGAIIGAAGMRAVTVAPEPVVVTKEVVTEVPVTPTPGAAAPAAPATEAPPAEAPAAEAPAAPAAPKFTTALPYPRTKLANVGDLTVGEPLKASYPDANSPIYVLKFGKAVMGGAGPDGDIVAFSRLCPHMGCTMKQFNSEQNTLVCGCHYSMFDLSKGGMMVIGQASDNLPQVELEVDGNGDIYAVGMHGLIYGRLFNVLPSEQA